jgi:hypothetical protein
MVTLTHCNPPEWKALPLPDELPPTLHSIIVPDSTIRIAHKNEWSENKRLIGRIWLNGIQYELDSVAHPRQNMAVFASKKAPRAKIGDMVSLEMRYPDDDRYTFSAETRVSKTSSAEIVLLNPKVSEIRIDEPQRDTYSIYNIGNLKLKLISGSKPAYFMVAFYQLHAVLPVDFFHGGSPTFNTNLPSNAAFEQVFSSSGPKSVLDAYPYRIFCFDNSLFRNKTAEVDIRFQYFSHRKGDFPNTLYADLFIVHEISYETFRFMEQANLQDNINELPYSEPVIVDGNITHANGVFGSAVPLLYVPCSVQGRTYLERNGVLSTAVTQYPPD